MSTGRLRPTSDFDRLASAWLTEGPEELADRVLAAALREVHLTRQRRLRVPWRFLTMPALSRAAGVAAVAIVAIVGVGGIIYLNNAPGEPGAPTATPTATTAPTPAPTEVAPGITAWTTYTSAIYGTSFGYPSDWSVRAPAVRNWQAGDAFPADELPYADEFVSPGEGDAQIGLIVWQRHIDIFTGTENLKALADKFCDEVVRSSCETFTQRAAPLDFNNGNRGGCAILVPTADQQYAFLSDRSSCLITEATSWITVVVVAREEDFPSAVRYGGSVELLKSIITTMNVWRPGQ